MKNVTYAIADLHGRYDLLDLAIAKIEELGGGTVVFMGDYIDRGPQSRQIIERLIGGPPTGQLTENTGLVKAQRQFGIGKQHSNDRTTNARS